MNYVMSDIHGNDSLFFKMLETINFKKNDNLYICGDVLDRGKNPWNIIKYVKNNKNIIMLMGNHEKMFLDALFNKDSKYFDLWFYNGGITSFDTFKELPENERDELVEYIKKLPYIYLIEDKYLLFHASPPINSLNLTPENKDIILWNRIDINKDFHSNYILIGGHTPTRYYGMKNNNIYYNEKLKYYDIDCGSFFSNKLGCLRLEDKKEFYAVAEENKN